MSPIQGLLKKDYRISRLMFLTWVGAVLLLMAFGFGFSAYTAQPVGTLPIFVIIALSQFVFGPIMMLTLLNIEGKNQLWLYSPRASYTLLLSKFGVIFTYQIVIQLLLTIYAAISLFWFGKSVYEQIGAGFFTQSISWLNVLLLLASISLTCWITFFWTVYQSLKSKPKIRPFRWVIIILLAFFYSLFEALLLEIDTINEFILRYKFNLFTEASLQYADGEWSALFYTTDVPIIPIIYYSILAVVLFIAAARLLEKKVEV
ncbi:hypothetical protein ACOI1C_04415 [Bacillus sp. DJP31]|uniref:hypothetical protein n=1 Tax=Bacillus sp. DJP31 TaxID=3409789 RepID=UPI003BB488D1